MYAEDGDSSNASRHPATSDSEEQTMQGRVQPFEPGALAPAQRELFEAIAGGPRAQGPQHFALTSPTARCADPSTRSSSPPSSGAHCRTSAPPSAIAERSPPRARDRDPARRGALGQRIRARGARSGRSGIGSHARRAGRAPRRRSDRVRRRRGRRGSRHRAAAGRRPRRRALAHRFRGARRGGGVRAHHPRRATTRRSRCSCACSASRRDCGWPVRLHPDTPADTVSHDESH